MACFTNENGGESRADFMPNYQSHALFIPQELIYTPDKCFPVINSHVHLA